MLNGARHITLGGHYAYIARRRGLVVVDLNDPLKPRVAAHVALPDMRASALQFRYLFVTDARGLEVVDVTRLDKPVPIAGATRAAGRRPPGLCRAHLCLCRRRARTGW